MGGRWVILDNGHQVIDRKFIPDAPGSDLALREAIITMANNGIEAGDTLKVIEGTQDVQPQ